MAIYTGKSYKYRAFGNFGDKEKKRITDLLVDNKLYFAGPSSLNDPFEVRPCTSTRKDRLRQFILRKINSSPMTRHFKEKEKSRLATKYMHNYGVLCTSDNFQQIANKFVGVYCMSKKADLLTQWAYYGDEHRGFSVEFDCSKCDQFFYCAEVEYVDQLPVVDMPEFMKRNRYTKDVLKKIVKTKSKQWQHEKEVRFIRDLPGLMKPENRIITGIVFGAKIKDQHREFIEDLNAKNRLGLRLRQCSFSDSEFGLVINCL